LQCSPLLATCIEIGSPLREKTSSLGLAFIAYPAAIETLDNSNFWTLMLALTLFTLGIDSAFSLVEATSTVIYDTETGRKLPRKITAMILCVLGAFISTIFCSNWGFTYFDVVDHYLAVYLMLILGILQCFGAGWVYEADVVMEKLNTRSVMVLAVGYWSTLIVLGILAYFAFPNSSWVSIPIFWGIVIILWIVSYFISSAKSFSDWYANCFLYGVRKLARSMSILSYERGHPLWLYHLFEFWWGFSIKYFCPFAIWWLLMMSLQNDLATPYGGYHSFWQFMGFLYPIVGLLCFLIPVFLCTKKEEFSKEIDEAFTDMDLNKLAQDKETEWQEA